MLRSSIIVNYVDNAPHYPLVKGFALNIKVM